MADRNRIRDKDRLYALSGITWKRIRTLGPVMHSSQPYEHSGQFFCHRGR